MICAYSCATRRMRVCVACCMTHTVSHSSKVTHCTCEPNPSTHQAPATQHTKTARSNPVSTPDPPGLERSNTDVCARHTLIRRGHAAGRQHQALTGHRQLGSPHSRLQSGEESDGGPCPRGHHPDVSCMPVCPFVRHRAGSSGPRGGGGDFTPTSPLPAGLSPLDSSS